ncbi:MULTISPECIES: hypothetical protein [Pseudoalteromonas]|uniref:Uncharacterized protein n=1 Tax=Pseudoalteromonas luteoviolacea (strain 2ta16) TaxID=1353533 RepID=V4JDP7_PSEL2|nr:MULTISPECIES: hypothetical protein [Pseudoalteromonas]ESP93197.1 hypothetical protein PL2TA16_03418 [Pseudoalteromonas luteoviolacea 2ta16]KZN37069.1 hypothetical protein N483_21730 [Pseudoalteromonas luteoviolacea NCIMB 1944]MCG7549998.1 hypothetical protein [Pseudoalteromonas sp. Of7M-16]
MKPSMIIPLSILLSAKSLAGTLFYDTDGNAGRVTYYDQGAIDAMVTQSSSAYNIRVYTPHYLNNTPCQKAAIYDENTDKLLSRMRIEGKVLTAEIPKGHEYSAKYVEAECAGNTDIVSFFRHKLAPAPKVKLNSNIEAALWSEGDHLYPGFYQDVSYSAILNIDNSEPDGFCFASSIESDSPLSLASRHSKGFYSDVLSFNEAVQYDARTGLIAAQVVCRNTGGTTRVTEIWKIAKDNINLDISTNIN